MITNPRVDAEVVSGTVKCHQCGRIGVVTLTCRFLTKFQGQAREFLRAFGWTFDDWPVCGRCNAGKKD